MPPSPLYPTNPDKPLYYKDGNGPSASYVERWLPSDNYGAAGCAEPHADDLISRFTDPLKCVPIGNDGHSYIVFNGTERFSPGYLAAHGRPHRPEDLRAHDCNRFRTTTGAVPKWEFMRGTEKIEIAVEGSLITNDLDHVVRAALNGLGISYMLEECMAPHITAGRLVPVLEDWCLPFAGYHLFYPSRRQVPPKLKAFIAFLQASAPKRGAMWPRLAAMTDAA